MAVNYRLPTFNRTCNVWFNQGGTNPPVGPPDAVFICQLQLGRKLAVTESVIPCAMWMLLPSLTNIHPVSLVAGFLNGDEVEVPANSGRFYQVQAVDDVALGFPNEHRFALLTQTPLWPNPIPGGAVVPPLVPILLGLGGVNSGAVISGVGPFS